MPDQFYSLTLNQYELMCEGYINKEVKQWKVARWSTWNMMNAWLGKMPAMEKFLPLPGDSKAINADTVERMKVRITEALEEYKNGRKA